jgi:hypothetical protein
MERLVIDELQEANMPPEGGLLGHAFYISPENQSMILDFTTNMGGCSARYFAFTFQLPRWNYVVKKVDEWLEVSPIHAETYSLTVAQKQKLESAIKTGLASVTQAVADYELLKHDERRYREIIDFFKKGMKDEHVLRSLFVDRVDVYTGEGYSLVTMAKRWPTIITDFIRMKTEWTDINEIRKELDVTQAEATVLKTKNELYKEWKEVFFPIVKERYARIKTLVDARKKSIDEYKNWLKPYITRYKMLREQVETKPSEYLTNPVMTPGFMQAVAFSGVRLWVWKVFTPAEMHKPEAVPEKKGFLIDPYDDFVREWKKKIEKKYNVEITDKEVRELLKEATAAPLRGGTQLKGMPTEMSPTDLYYILFDIVVTRSIIKTPPPEGKELENMMFNPLRTWLVSQNVLLIHLLELRAREKHFDKYINEIIGAKEFEEAELERIEKEFKPEEQERFQSLKRFIEKTSKVANRIKSMVLKGLSVFVRPGPYESTFDERVTKMYLIGSGGLYKQIVDFMKTKFDVG